jgi:hypothetical protein
MSGGATSYERSEWGIGAWRWQVHDRREQVAMGSGVWSPLAAGCCWLLALLAAGCWLLAAGG